MHYYYIYFFQGLKDTHHLVDELIRGIKHAVLLAYFQPIRVLKVIYQIWRKQLRGFPGKMLSSCLFFDCYDLRMQKTRKKCVGLYITEAIFSNNYLNSSLYLNLGSFSWAEHWKKHAFSENPLPNWAHFLLYFRTLIAYNFVLTSLFTKILTGGKRSKQQ